MEANKIKGEAKGLLLETGTELTYCERGAEHKEVLLTGAFYFHTAMPIVELLAQRYHVYGVVMRFDGPAEELNPDGSVNWARQWGKDLYDFACAMGIEKFIYFGKCHGTVPGWYIAKEHPEMLDCFASFYMMPHIKGQTSNTWFEAMSKGLDTMMSMALRKPKSGLPKKMEEMASIGDSAQSPIVPLYAAAPEKIWNSIEECDEFLKNMTIPVGYCFANDDPVFQDYYESNIYGIMNTRGARTTILNGEKHLMELDSPERVASEVFGFIDECHKGFYNVIMEPDLFE